MTSKMSVLRIKTLSIVVLLLEQLMVCESRSCSWSKKSARTVDSCPESKDELQERINIKNCSSLALIQNCTEPAKFRYHCLIDEAEKKFIEVCVPIYNILLGYCAEYNTIGALVQQHRGLKCSDMNPQCPQVYKSTDAYLYKGCYEIVRNRTQTTSSDIDELSTKFTTKENYKNTSLENIDIEKTSNAGMIIAIIFAVILAITIVTSTVMVVRYRMNRGKRRLKNGDNELENPNDSSDSIQNETTKFLSNLEVKNPSISSLTQTDGSKMPDFETHGLKPEEEEDKECSIEEFKEEMDKAELLRVTVAVEEKEMTANFNRKRDDAKSFLQAYEAVLICFEKTGLLKKCQHSLKKNGITILSGQQGSGKTLSAVYIMTKSKRYEQWTKLKFTSWVDLLTIELEAKTLVYIDNLFDGYMYMYPEELRKWWHSLCYFYFKRIRSKKDIHLLITVKDDVMKEACEQIETNIDEKPFYLKADQFPLTDEERKKILGSQFKLAKELKNIDNPEIDSTYADIKEKNKSCAIGFPLCAHIYAFERKAVYKTKSIFSDPVSYVIHHFEREIDEDRTSSVKTLFLFLLFYTNPSSSKQSRRLDLRYAKDIREYMEEVVPENLVKEMEPLNFENLPTKAKLLEYTILIKQSSMFEFKHQIYLDGASDYFLRKSPEVAVDNFPLTIIRSYAFPDAAQIVWNNLVRRFERELKRNINIQDSNMDIESCKNMIPEVLSCKIFDKEQFEIEFKKELEKSGVLYRLLLSKRLCFAFWASRFCRRHLSATALNLVEHSDYQFYLGLFGECCERDKKYYSESSTDMDLVALKEKVWKFKTLDGKSILHLVLGSERSDYDAHLVLEKMLREMSEHDVSLINDLLKCASEHLACSRILCMLELLQKQNESLTGPTPLDVPNLLAQLKHCKVYDVHLELEILVRICIVFANWEALAKKVNTKHSTIDKRFRHVRNFLHENINTQSKMTKVINDCVAECRKSQVPRLERKNENEETKNIPFTNKMRDGLKQAIYDSVQMLSRRNNQLKN